VWEIGGKVDLRNPSRSGATLDPGKVIVCLRGTGQGFEDRLFVVTSQGAHIGRNPDCEILLNHPTVSRSHCRIELSPAGVRVRDLGSVNGTWINGVMRMDSWLRQWDVVRVGGVDLVVEIRPISSLGEVLPPPVGVPSQEKVGTTRLLDIEGLEPKHVQAPSDGAPVSRLSRFTQMLFRATKPSRHDTTSG